MLVNLISRRLMLDYPCTNEWKDSHCAAGSLIWFGSEDRLTQDNDYDFESFISENQFSVASGSENVKMMVCAEEVTGGDIIGRHCLYGQGEGQCDSEKPEQYTMGGEGGQDQGQGQGQGHGCPATDIMISDEEEAGTDVMKPYYGDDDDEIEEEEADVPVWFSILAAFMFWM